MKKLLFIVIAVFAILMVVLAAVPYLFKDEIFNKLDQELAKTVNAQVYYDRDMLSLSVFKNFPQLTAGMGEFGIKGNPPFQNDTLVHLGRMQVDLDIWSVIFDDNPSLKGLHLLDGEIYVKVLEDGMANYDIMFETEEEEVEEPTPSAFQLGIDLIEVRNLNFIYDDRSLDYIMVLSEMNLEGSGELTTDVYDLDLSGGGNIVNLSYEGIEYLTKKKMTIDSKINVDLNEMRFAAKDANLTLNEFGFGVDGFLAMPADDIEVDVRFNGDNNDFRSVLSLVPGIYSESFQDLNTSGEMDFSGMVKGVYNESSFPAFQFNLNIDDGMFQYPELPRPVQHVNMDLTVLNESGNLDYTSINLSKFSLEFGNQPFIGSFMLKDLVNYEMDAKLKGTLDLLEMTAIFPLEDMELKGRLAIDVDAAGRYDTLSGEIPKIDAEVSLSDGFIKSNAYPAPLNNINVKAMALNKTGQMKDLTVNVSSFGFELEEETITGKLLIDNLEALNYDFSIHGALDLGKIASILPLEEMVLEGRIQADIDASGSYEAIEKKRFNQLATSGELKVSDFYFADPEYPQGIRIHEASTEFGPQAIQLSSMDARFGKSPVQANGTLSNYMAYLLGEAGQELKGDLNLYSSNFNVNEWMTDSEDADADTTSLELVALPANIDFRMKVEADRITYDNLTLEDASGSMHLKDAVLRLEGFKTKTLGGSLAFDGSYTTRDILHPSFDMTLDISSLGVQEAFQSFVTVRAFAPIAQHVTGNFSTKFSFSGLLGQDMMPVLSSLDGKGLIRLAETAIRDSPLIQGITSITKLNDAATLRLKPLNISAEIVDGMLNIAPFELQLWDYPTRIQGSTGFDGRINYLVAVDVPANKFGSQINNLVSGALGTDLSNTTIPLAFNVGGSYNKPQVSLASADNLESYLANTLKNRLTNEKENVQEQIAAEFKAKEDSLKQEISEKARVARDSVEKEAEKLIESSKEKAVDEVKNLLKGFTNRKKTAEPEKSNPE
ncbi:AsmA-like C-terminal region-containing protein [Cyclobacterium plantarum]|uniref:AsmA family protein n=1 Tax=Cyclobacterium plantarum TaxID=2716263 RepID=A0ABX0H0F6_9BACT|nr:AsmA-like C-terminal region-containing protein [Cyclobacterium plantarum]NHE55274.1 AsmA family protein [Cyclobacterium plantarum]